MGTEKVEIPLTQERLRAVLDYDPATGLFTYRVRVAQCVRIGDVAGSVNTQGYRHIRVGGAAYKAHRLAIFYMTGDWPKEFVDHVDGSRDHNSYANLREATRSQNLANSTTLRRGKAVHKGVRFSAQSRRWTARIQRDKVSYFLGYFNTEPEAVAAYQAAASYLFGSYARKDAA